MIHEGPANTKLLLSRSKPGGGTRIIVCVPHAGGKAVAVDDELLEDETEGTTRADAEAST